jgi:hypothetical protein
MGHTESLLFGIETPNVFVYQLGQVSRSLDSGGSSNQRWHRSLLNTDMASNEFGGKALIVTTTTFFLLRALQKGTIACFAVPARRPDTIFWRADEDFWRFDYCCIV